MTETATMRNEACSRDTLARLVMARWVLLSIEGILVMVLMEGFAVALPMLAMVVLLTLHGALNLVAIGRLDRGGQPLEVMVYLMADAEVIGALIYFTGGYANPFISLLLVPLILCAVTLPGRYAWVMTLWVAVLYSLLARYYQPLGLAVSEQTAIDLHLGGMWLNFLLTAALVAAFVTRLATALRQREADLARVREQALRDEQLFALGMQAAAAAHDLATPLSSLRVSLRELERDYAGDDELAPGIAVMAAQAERMKGVLDRLAAAAGGARATVAPTRALDGWLAEIFDHWGLMRPGAHARLRLDGPRPGPAVREDPVIISVLSTLLNNAADVSPDDLGLEAEWDADTLRLAVLDRGPAWPRRATRKTAGASACCWPRRPWNVCTAPWR
ncbi:HAMP domain-containing histidine kinase [Parasulfuritortus cantonensis]|uniref:histidine kinase n=1 Tax=Parasulfuritortus cantonensis TaxID=2528202 RepID=A0A4R1BCF1_9PROT|nr:HAMP domain-containing histidine kinase [Parasulfuritortus cantonensis]TCJ14725.1 HAMP domain-containing histidine kinase [Parasulfuritortus cantonensis]